MSETTLFDHRLRLEKEYELYTSLWDKLFELRRAVGQLVAPLSDGGVVCHAEQCRALFSAYQELVRKGEPFEIVSESVEIEKSRGILDKCL